MSTSDLVCVVGVPQRFYVSMTWEDWPACGSYGTVVMAMNQEEATRLCMHEMAACESEGGCLDDHDEADHDLILDQQDWHLVDCFPLDDFIQRHTKEIS